MQEQVPSIRSRWAPMHLVHPPNIRQFLHTSIHDTRPKVVPKLIASNWYIYYWCVWHGSCWKPQVVPSGGQTQPSRAITRLQRQHMNTTLVWGIGSPCSFPGGLIRISELFGVSSREWWETGTAAAANGLPHRRNWMFILWLAEAGCAVADIPGWAGAQQCWSGWGRARWRGNYRPHCFLALSVRLFFSGGGKAVFTASLEPGHQLFSERACCLPLNCTV